ncbi:pyridoxamine 5'-phosphate oxidase family protein [Synechococcus sp. PCC 7335]|uniref:pyridoxamine 5'-phosphate oxidase family protein n=1 Tax=Synechococcus sp. (strain ATCC 29403 / PCC 7335) TaxID=91464 RepID=UPI00017EDFE1|nr:pyridoxamine 5'-phosphate oxidase family protein [Synechococcus sp. PCC 7335]EDX84633.1 pyridoxamine 5'-phosphate oxidase family protein [Synechococcus sp. PCC 7335]
MVRKFGELAFTPEVKAVQTARGSRQTYERYIAQGEAGDVVTPEIASFIAQLNGFYFGTVSSNGYPYIQFRGGPPGFLHILDDKTLGFADFTGNVQYITVGNLSSDEPAIKKAFLFLMDYRHRRRIKVWGRARYTEDEGLIAKLSMPDYPAKVERAILFEIDAFSENCPQHIPVRYSEDEVKEMIETSTSRLRARIAELESQQS